MRFRRRLHRYISQETKLNTLIGLSATSLNGGSNRRSVAYASGLLILFLYLQCPQRLKEAEVERVSSQTRRLVTQDRNRLGEGMVEALRCSALSIRSGLGLMGFTSWERCPELWLWWVYLSLTDLFSLELAVRRWAASSY